MEWFMLMFLLLVVVVIRILLQVVNLQNRLDDLDKKVVQLGTGLVDQVEKKTIIGDEEFKINYG